MRFGLFVGFTNKNGLRASRDVVLPWGIHFFIPGIYPNPGGVWHPGWRGRPNIHPCAGYGIYVIYMNFPDFYGIN